MERLSDSKPALCPGLWSSRFCRVFLRKNLWCHHFHHHDRGMAGVPFRKVAMVRYLGFVFGRGGH
jgi:hypothetical protein